MGIRQEDIDRVRSGTDLVALVSEYVQLRQVGARWVGLCPFHTEKTGSFNVNPDMGRYHCFGCGAGGDAIDFVENIEHVDFPEAMERLAGRMGVSLTYDKPGENRERGERKRLVELVARAEDWYHERLLSAPDAAEARRYLRDRGFDGDEVRSWKLGWAPDDWDQLARALQIPKKDLKPSGLGFENRRGRAQDHFRGRVLFPIHDADGKPVGFGGRVLPGHEGSKYVNTSSECLIYDKSRVLFALDRAKANMVEANEAIVCEGYTDVTAFFRIGLPRAVATCGTAMTDDHVRLLRKYASRIVLAFDADAAGQAAADRFYEWESKLEVDVVVAAMPPGVDPADLADRDPEALRTAIADARPFLEFRLDRVLDAMALDTPAQRARAAETALGVVAEHPSPLVRDQFVMRIADRTRVQPDVLREQLRIGAYKTPEPPQPKARRDEEPAPEPVSRADRRRAHVDDDPGPREPGEPIDDRPPPDPRRHAVAGSGAGAAAALEVLRLAVHRPADVVEWLDPVLFEDPTHRGCLEALVSADTLHEAMDTAGPDVATLLGRLVVEECLDDALDPVVRLIDAYGRRLLAAERGRAEPDLARTAGLARLLDRIGTSSDGIAAARELLSFGPLEGAKG